MDLSKTTRATLLNINPLDATLEMSTDGVTWSNINSSNGVESDVQTMMTGTTYTRDDNNPLDIVASVLYTETEDALFIAAARNALPGLLRVARAAQAWNDAKETVRAWIKTEGAINALMEDKEPTCSIGHALISDLDRASEALTEIIKELSL